MKKIEGSSKVLKLKVEDRQIKIEELRNEVKNDVFKEMIKKENICETKLKCLEDKHKNDVEELKKEMLILKTKTENLESTTVESVTDPTNIALKELKGRNVTIVKAATEMNTPKTVTKNEEKEGTNKSETNVKPKPKKLEITKKVTEERLISACICFGC